MYPLLNGGDAAILYCFVFLFIAVAGGGPARARLSVIFRKKG